VEQDLRLWALKQPPTYLVESLRDRLAELSQPGLADALANGRLSPLPPPADGPLNPEQRQAYAACWMPGLRLVWGPPGTGKTMVLRRAISDLLRAGKRVLLVSSTNVAVDNALTGVIEELRPPAGRLVRVGTPQLPEIAANADVSLPKLKEAYCSRVADQRAAVEQQLVELANAARQVEDLTARLERYDHAAYQRAAELLSAERRITSLAQQAQERAATADAARRAAMHAERALEAAHAALEEIREPRNHLEEAAELQRRLEQMEIAVGELQAEILQSDNTRRERQRAVREIKSLGPLPRLRRGAEQRRLQRELDAITDTLRDLAVRERAATSNLERQRTLLEPRIAEHRRWAEPVDDAEVERRQAALDAARRASGRAMEELALAEKALDGARGDLLAAESGPRPTSDQRQLVAEAGRERWPQQYVDLVALRRQVRDAAPRAARLEREHERLVAELDKLGRDAEKLIIGDARLIATTLAKFRLHQSVYEGPYDVVLVDEVSAATVPEVLLATARANKTAVLFGDFLQLGAVTDDAVEKLDNPYVKKWLMRDCFAVCGITRPSDAQSLASQGHGCVVLHYQYRFGDGLMGLANRLMYAGNLRNGRDVARRDDDDPEIVLLDTDGLGDLAMIRRTKRVAGWWPAWCARPTCSHRLAPTRRWSWTRSAKGSPRPSVAMSGWWPSTTNVRSSRP
jgi:AAA domain